VALALRMLCGLSTTEVAKAFLVKESAMAARLTRAKKKIALARIPYRSLYGPNFGPYRRRSLGHSPPLYDRSHVTSR